MGSPNPPDGAVADPSTAMTVRYDGGDTGTLTLKGAFGEIALPARKQIRTGSVQGFNDGKEYSAIGIQGDGPATIVMPDKAGIEACVASKPVPEGLTAEENVFMALMPCMASAAPGTAKVPVTVSVEIAFVSTAPPKLELMTATMKRTYTGNSNVPGGTITIESDPRCEIVND